MLSHPLCPFFVVFCNVVGTSDGRDFQLLEDVTDAISSLVTENKYVNRLHRLCATLIGLCKPLAQNARRQDQIQHENSDQTTPAAPMPVYHSSMAFSNGPDTLNPNGGEGTNTMMPSSWNDDMMWQLFQSQPSLDWFNADILDPSWGLGQAA